MNRLDAIVTLESFIGIANISSDTKEAINKAISDMRGMQRLVDWTNSYVKGDINDGK